MSSAGPPSGPPGPPTGPPGGSSSGHPSGPPSGTGTPPAASAPTPVPQPAAAYQPTPTPTVPVAHMAVPPAAAGSARSARPPWLPAAVIIGAALLLLVGFLVLSKDDTESSASRSTSPRTTGGATSTSASSTTTTTVAAATSGPTTLATSTVAPSTTAVGTTLAGVPGEIFLEPRVGVGPDPFTPSIDTTPPELGTSTGSPPAIPFPKPPPATPNVPGTSTTKIAANSPGLYGGTRNRSECNKEQLVSFLQENPEKAAAWAAVQQIAPADIPRFVSTLRSVILLEDTRVTNYGFKDGKAPARQVVLQKRTAVMIDEFGHPRVRCYCGNPLREPQPEPTPTYTGDTWDDFDRGAVTVISPSPTPIVVVILVDVFDGGPFTRSVDGTDTPVQMGDITAQGVVGAASEYPGGEFPASLAVDRGPAAAKTSWFSAGPGAGDPTLFAWYAPAGTTPFITAVTIIGNAAHPDYPTGFGFGSVTVEITDLNQNVVWTQTVALDGTPDPDVTVYPDVYGTDVQLWFTGHESPDCGGFADLIITGFT